MNATPEAVLSVDEFDAFVERLRRHDWYYNFSDDGSVWRNGEEADATLRADAARHPTLQAAFDAYYSAQFCVHTGFSGDGLTRAELPGMLDALRSAL